MNERTDRTLFPISLSVLAIHALLILYMSFFIPSTLKPEPKRERLLVKTIKLSNERTFNPPKAQIAPPEPIAEAPTPIETAPEPIIEIEPLVEPTPEPEIIKPEPIPEPEPAPKPKPISPPKPKAPPKPIVKKTPPKPTPQKKPPAPVKNPAPPKPIAKKTPPKPATPPPPPAPPKPDPEIARRQEQRQALLAQARSAIGKVDTKKGRITGSSLEKITLPSQMGELSTETLAIMTDAGLSKRESSYRDEIAARLSRMLNLPEVGVVNLKLTLNRDGKVISVKITSAENAKNKSHIEKTLPNIKFPSFGDNFPNESSYTFSISLTADVK